MPQYRIREDSGARDIITADSLDEALERAKEWSADGEYDERVMVDVWAVELDDDGEEIGEEISGDVQAGPEPQPPPSSCGETDDDHDWQYPLELVGGCTENPGVFATGGTTFSFCMVCARCGIYRDSYDTGWQRNPGELDTGVSYRPASPASLAWVAAQE